MNCHSESGEDVFLHRLGVLPPTGTYLDLGCAHPEIFSHTAWLRDRGWNGLAVDANPLYAPHWEKVSPERGRFVAAILADDPEVPFDFRENGLVSRIQPGAPLHRAISIRALLAEYRVTAIDFLCLDLEGAEFDVLRSLRVEDFWPQVIVAEYNTEGLGEDFRARELLLATGRYTVIQQTAANLIYLRK